MTPRMPVIDTTGYPFSRRSAGAVVMAALVLLAANNIASPQDDPVEKEAKAAPAEVARGRLVRLPLPITGNVDRRVVQQIQRALVDLKADDGAPEGQRPVLILEFAPGQTQFGLGSEFEDSLKLARFLVSPQLDGVKTVAFVPRSIKGHAVLAAIACEQIVIAPDAEMGDAGADHDADHPIDETITSGYRQIARSRRTVPIEIALGMLDPQYEVLQVETEDGPQLVFAKDLAALRESKTIDDAQTQVVFAAGEPGVLSGREARHLSIASYLAEDRSEVAQHLGLPRKALAADPFLEGELRAQLIMIDRPLDAKLAETRLRMMDDAIENRVNFLCLWIDSPGGSAEAASKLASYLARLESEEVLTAAYVPNEARGSAALVALACDDVVMHPDAVLGGGEMRLTDEEVLDLVAVIDEEIAPGKSRSPSLLAAMVQKDLVVHRYKNRRTGLEKYFTGEELADLQDKDEWQRGALVTDVGERLKVDGAEAEQLGLASSVVNNFEQFKQEYGLLDDPALSEPTWADNLIRALASPGFAWLLLMIGLVGMYTELQMPGIGIGGFIAAVAFTLYFWANFLEGTAGALEIVLFVVGISCLVLEVFVIPGFGIFGLGGGVMILVSLVLASQTFVLPSTSGEVHELRDSLLVVGGAVVGLVGSSMVMHRFLPHAPLFNRLMLAPPEGQTRDEIAQREAMADYHELVGQRGTATTQLTPSGKARFGDELVDVIADGEMIPLNAEIEVVEVHGNRVIVQAVQ